MKIHIETVRDKKKQKNYESSKDEFSCQICGKKFTARPLLKKHVETEYCSSSDSEEISGQYKCSDCPKHFPSDSLLKLHQSLSHMQFDQ